MPLSFPGGGTSTPTPKATNATSGTVKTDLLDADPVVYLKDSVDTLIAGVTTPPDTAYINVAQQFTKTQGVASVMLTDAATISVNASLSNKFVVTIGGNRTIANPTNLQVASYIFTIRQDGIGSRTLTFGTAFKFPNGALPVLSTFPGSKDKLYCDCDDGATLDCVLVKDSK